MLPILQERKVTIELKVSLLSLSWVPQGYLDSTLCIKIVSSLDRICEFSISYIPKEKDRNAYLIAMIEGV